MNLRQTFFAVTVSLACVAGIVRLSSAAAWLGSPQALPGTPWSVQIQSSNASGTHLVLECPGFWTETVLQEGVLRTRISLPEAGITTQTGLPELPAIGRLLAIPADRAAEVLVHQVILASFPCENPYLAEPYEPGESLPEALNALEETFPLNWAEAQMPVIMKDHRLAPVNLFPLRYDPQTKELLLATRLELEIRTVLPSTDNVKTHFEPSSEAFAPLYQSAIDNLSEFNTASPLVGEGARGKYLIFINETFQDNAFLVQLMTWKRQLGYQVILHPIPASGYSNDQIKEVITQEYYAGDAPLDYVLLIGDVSGVLAIPYYTITKPGSPQEIDPTDHEYALLEGDDYFPDIMVGRLSVTSEYELSSALKNTLTYERDPYVANPAWFKRALLSAGNFSDQGIPPITPAWTTLWLMDKLYDFGYTQVDTVIYWGPGDPWSYPGTPNILNSLNTGDGLVAYRGWGDASGWQYPIFKVDNIMSPDLSNGAMLPVVVSIVCETGNYGDPATNPCFGEAWLRAGTPTTPKGGAAFYGPTDLHTNTKWNNPLYAGFFEGLLEENLYRLGQSALRSKLELYYGFPENTGIGDYAEFYFHTYNILGDPELSIWTDTPAALTLEAPAQITPGRQIVTATVRRADGSPAGGAYIAFYKVGEVLAGDVADGSGTAAVEIEPLTAGALTCTASKQNCIPEQQNISVQVGNFPVGISAVRLSGDGVAQAGETLEMTISVQNYGSTSLDGVEAELSENDPYASLNTSTATLGTISASGTAPAQFSVTLSPSVPDGYAVEFTLLLSNADYSAEDKFLLYVGGLQLVPAGFVLESGSLNPGGSAQIRLLLCNAGFLPAQALNGLLSCSSGAVNITANQSLFPVLQPNVVGMSSAQFSLLVNAEAATGQQVILDLDITAAGGYSQKVSFPLQLGQPAATDPLGPDSYGYYAYDNTDQDYAEVPEFNWIELDPEFGGTGATYYPLLDDMSLVVGMPFTFTYYGADFDTLTICSNGLISFGETWMTEFRNWNIPSALGPPNLIAPFWDDLKPDTIGLFADTTEFVEVFTKYDNVQGRFIIEWSRSVNRFGYEVYSSWKEETFELVLSDPAVNLTQTGDGEILFQYLVVNDVDDNNNYATVGIEDEAHRRGLQYAYSNDYPSAASPLTANRAIKITTDPPSVFAGGSGSSGLPTRTIFSAPQPNPANPGTVLRFALPEEGIVQIELYNALGRRVAVLMNGNQSAGSHSLQLHGEALPSGIYFAVLRFGRETLTQKVLILK